MRCLWAGFLMIVPLCVFAGVEDERSQNPPGMAAPVPAPLSTGECEPAPTPLPPPDLTPDLFRAVAAADTVAVARLLDGGVDANATLPQPVPQDLSKRFRDTNLEYYISVEKGLTPLMLASAMGYSDIVRLLLERGAKRGAVTKKHRTFALWLAGRNGHVEVMQLLLGVAPGSDAGQAKIHISLADQTAWFWKDGKIERSFPVSTGSKKLPTPKGRFVVTDKYKDWKSTIYPAKMPFFLRLSCKDFGMHAGVLPGYPASHGCIRIPVADARVLFEEVQVGTLVEIE